MKAFFFSFLTALALSAITSATPPSPNDHIPARGNAQYGPADPLTLVLRGEAYRESLYGNTTTQSPIPDQPEIVADSVGCEPNCQSTLSFAGPAAKDFEVGNYIPGIGFKTRNSWAGNMPIGSSTDKELYFWLWGAETPSDDLVIWMNGGPGCSSLFGFMQENGTLDFNGKAAKDASNTTSWTQMANMLWIEHPIGTGFTVGNPYSKDEDDVAAAFAGFLDNFYKTFPELKSKKLWLTGESYAGVCVPYIASALYKAGNKHNLQGIFIIDGVISDLTLHFEVVVSDFVLRTNDKYLHLPQKALDKIKARAEKCGYGFGNSSYVAKNLNYPPKGPLPAYNKTGCGTYEAYQRAAYEVNPDFNIYYVAPEKDSGSPNVLTTDKTFFDDEALQSYINAPYKKWYECNDVFLEGDNSPPPDQVNLAYVIESAPSKRNVISNGDLDGLVTTEGVALALQGLKWNGKRGFSTPPSANKLIDTKGKVSGGYVTERGLSFATIEKSGHETPYYTPDSGLKILSYLLGKTDSLGA